MKLMELTLGNLDKVWYMDTNFDERLDRLYQRMDRADVRLDRLEYFLYFQVFVLVGGSLLTIAVKLIGG